jgi:hypothetical protein
LANAPVISAGVMIANINLTRERGECFRFLPPLRKKERGL